MGSQLLSVPTICFLRNAIISTARQTISSIGNPVRRSVCKFSPTAREREEIMQRRRLGPGPEMVAVSQG